MQTDQDFSANLRAELSCYTGTENYYRHALRKDFLYTDGVQYFAEQASCYWFIDTLAIEVFSLQKISSFLVAELDVTGNTAQIRVTDGNENLLWHRKVQWTDAPQGLWRCFLCDDICLLPSEY